MRLLIIASLITVFACSKPNSDIQDQTELFPTDKPQTEQDSQSQSAAVEVHNLGVKLYPEYRRKEGYRAPNIEKVKLKGDSLVVTVNFSGGCAMHEFSLVHNGAFKESMPPELDVYLIHNKNGDACRARIKEKLGFNLSSLRYTEKGNLKINLVGYEEQILYTY